MSNKKNIFLWVSYDFANSLVQSVFFLYFAQWVVRDMKVEDIYFNLVFVVAAGLLLLTAPLVGMKLDAHWRRIVGLRLSTLAMIIFYGVTAILAISGLPILALVSYSLGLYFYLLTFTFYTPLINDISKPETRGRVSGFGIAAHYLGQIVALLAALPLATGSINIFGGLPRAEVLFPAVLMFAICALPMLIWFKETKRESTSAGSTNLRQVILNTKSLISVPGVGLFFLAYFLFNDAILTATNNFPIFLDAVWGIPDTTKTLILLVILLTSAIGGLLSGLVADKFGHKRTLMFVLSGWLIIFPALALVANFAVFVVIAGLMGFWFGSHWAVSRSVMAYLAPAGKHNLTFAYFSVVERASSFVGPLAWGMMVGGLVSIEPTNYRVSLAMMAVFIFLGLLALARVRSDRAQKEGSRK